MGVASGSSGVTPSFNGTSVGLNVGSGSVSATTGFIIGGPYAGPSSSVPNYINEMWPGNITEFNLFASANYVQKIIVENNQAAFYGLSVSNIVYTPANNYNLFVLGIGKYSSTDSLAATRETVGMGFMAGLTPSDFLKDNGDFFTAGNTCLTNSITINTYIPVTAPLGSGRFSDDWYINKTDIGNNGGDIQIYFDIGDYKLSITDFSSNPACYQLWGRASTTVNFTVVPVTNTAINGDRVVFTLPAANIGNSGYYTLGILPQCNVVLPIELIGFEATQLNNEIKLQWTTENERNNSYFIIEKSYNGASFDSMGRVNTQAPNGNSNLYLTYETFDKKPGIGTIYYRLKQVDRNGGAKFFKIISVNTNEKIQPFTFPNPTNGHIYINVPSDYIGSTISICDQMGRIVFFQKITESNLNTLDLTLIESGVYALSINDLATNLYKIKITIVK